MNAQEENLNVNSQEYWDNRFSTDWKAYSGNEQTAYFASQLNKMVPQWLVHEINENAYEICDLGCAEGDSLSVYRQVFLTSELFGEDFSQTAIQTAKEKYPQFQFHVSNIMEPEKEKKYPVIICSNVVEHFKETYKVLNNICERAEKYAIILLPYREEAGAISEHEHVFHTENIPARIGENQLIYAGSVNCQSPLYPYEQLLLIYAKDRKFYLLSELVEHLNSDAQKKQENDFLAQKAENQIKIADLQKRIEELTDRKIQSDIANKEKAAAIKAEYETTIKELRTRLKAHEAVLKEQKINLSNYEQTIESQQQVIGEQSDNLAVCTTQLQQLQQLQQQLSMALAVLKQKDEYLVQSQALCQHYATGKLMKLNHFLFRLNAQYFGGTKEDRKAFRSWMKGRRKHTNKSIGDGIKYNPWMVLNEKLKEGLACELTMQTGAAHNFDFCGADTAGQIPENLNVTHQTSEIHPETRNILQQKYTQYDVIILSAIDYDFRHQRPQHFATRFAENGHRVFYVNANFVRPDSVSEKQSGLYLVNLSHSGYNAIYSMEGRDTLDWMKEKFTALCYHYAIRDAIVIVDYPNWVYGAEYLNRHFGFKIVTDYMDDYTGFMGTAEDFLKDNCVRLLKASDLVVTSSQFLYEIACKYAVPEKIEIIRNGTETEHFYKAIGLEQPHGRKIIGYYGAVAHWFAWEKICYLAEKLPECDVVIVGEVTEYRDKLEKYGNIKLLGEKPYQHLPEFLADFDVCLIPFDTSTDLIKATNPVKFYEYLSAGKKIVATEIPELMPFRDEYVYMSNDNGQFLKYVKLCLENEDTLKNRAEAIAFARENDWQKRYENFVTACRQSMPQVSVIVLTYNNEEMNRRCINSILEKTAYGNYELIVVDNNSQDTTIDYLKELQAENRPNVTVILNEENKGFAGGNNQGIRETHGKYVLLLNNDTVVTRGWLTNLTKHMEQNPEYGMCNPVTNSIGNESKVRAVYKSLSEMEEFAYQLTFAHLEDEYTDVDRLPLFATIIHRDVIEKAGLLDEAYKVGMFEDDDYTERVLRAGYKIVIADDVFIHHINNGSFKKLDDEEYMKIFDTNKEKFEAKWKKRWTMPKYREGVTADCNLGCKI